MNEKKIEEMRNSVLEQWLKPEPGSDTKLDVKAQLNIMHLANAEETENMSANISFSDRRSEGHSINHSDQEDFEAAYKGDITDWNINSIVFGKEEGFGCAWRILVAEEHHTRFKLNVNNWWSFMHDLFYWYSYKENPFHNFNHGLNGTLPLIQ